MPSRPLSVVFHRLHSAAERDGTGATDGELLTRLLTHRDDDALAALVERHAPMVWGVCRRVLRHPHDAEDAFQATFLVLVRKAGTVRSRELLANWLYGVAHQTAVRMRATAAKRGWREVQMDVMPEPAVVEDRDEELLSRLDEELKRLPERCRALIVLCDLEGRTRKEVARQLGCPEGTVASGLARARELLAKRLTRRGLAVSGGSLAVTLSHSMGSADVPAAVVTSAINVATLLAAGKAAGVISGPVATLTQGVLKIMFLKKIMTTTMVVLALSVAVITGGSLAIGQTEGTGKPVAAKNVKQPAAEKPVEPAVKQKKEAFTAWGKEVGGLQAGLGFKAGEKRAYTHGETVTLVVRVRNVGNKDVKFQYYPKFLSENSPTVLDETGKRVSLRGNTLHIVKRDVPKEVNLAVGKEIELYERELRLAKGNEDADGLKTRDIFPKGKFLIQHEQVIGQSAQASDKLDPDLEKLATGKLELEVKEAFTAWGKEVGGLQAGLGFKAGEQRAYTHGETVTLVLRVCNVGKETVKFEYVKQFLDENRPTVTDAEGKTVRQPGFVMLGIHGPTEVALEPGKEIVLESSMHAASGLPYKLLPASSEGKAANTWWPLYAGTGKVSLQYERVLGNSSSGFIKLDPALSKLATGKLELEVKEAPAGKQKVLTPEEAIKIAGDSELTKKFNVTKPAVEFKVEFVTKATQVKASGEKDAGWVHGHSPDDVCLGIVVAAADPLRNTRFVAILTEKAIKQFNKAGINDLEKHFKGKTVRVIGLLARHDYRGRGSIPEVEIVLDDMSQIEVVK